MGEVRGFNRTKLSGKLGGEDTAFWGQISHTVCQALL